MGMFRVLILSFEKYEPTKQHFGVHKTAATCVEQCGGRFDCSELQKVLPKDVKTDYFANVTEKETNFYAIYWKSRKLG